MLVSAFWGILGRIFGLSALVCFSARFAMHPLFCFFRSFVVACDFSWYTIYWIINAAGWGRGGMTRERERAIIEKHRDLKYLNDCHKKCALVIFHGLRSRLGRNVTKKCCTFRMIRHTVNASWIYEEAKPNRSYVSRLIFAHELWPLESSHWLSLPFFSPGLQFIAVEILCRMIQISLWSIFKQKHSFNSVRDTRISSA